MATRTIRAEARTTIRRPVEVVFDWLTDPALVPRWVTGLVASRPEGSAELRLGARSVEEVVVRGRTIMMPAEIVELDPGRVVAIRIETPDGPFAVPVRGGGPRRHVRCGAYHDRRGRRSPMGTVRRHAGRDDLADPRGSHPPRSTGGGGLLTSADTPHGQLADVLPALLRVQVALGGDLSTAALAAVTNMSPSRFHEVFRRATGETVKQHTLRLRLERAAFRLLTERTGVAAIAFDLGFGSHEVFTRAIRRAHGISPTQFRRLMKPLSEPQVRVATRPLSPSAAYLSTTSAVLLQPAHLAFVRRVGPYDEVDPAEFALLLEWAVGRRLDPICLVGIAHDAPGITPTARLRFDVSVQVSRRFRISSEVGYQLLPERWCAATSYVGPFAGLADAYRAAYQGASEVRGFAVLGLPVEERYLMSALVTHQEIQTTQILIPLRRSMP